ncbi:MAG: hypothetical protein HC813_03465 [Planctomycetes bacterium]|nr:hypothetical protein [Planctomycetota bacterium]
MLFLGASLLLLPLWGFGAAGLIGTFPPSIDPRIVYALPLLGLAGWILAVSSWLPRGALSLPAALLLLGVLLLPLYLTYDRALGFVPTPPELILFTLVFGLGSLPIAWFSFVRGHRFGRGPLSAGWRGLLASLLLAAPVWAYAGHSAREWERIDAASAECQFLGGVLSQSGRYLYVNAVMREGQGPYHAIRLDLERGEWCEVGSPRDSIQMPLLLRPVAQVFVNEHASVALDELNPGYGKRWVRILDAETGAFARGAWSNTIQTEGSPRGGGRWAGRVWDGVSSKGGSGGSTIPSASASFPEARSEGTVRPSCGRESGSCRARGSTGSSIRRAVACDSPTRRWRRPRACSIRGGAW